MILTGHVGTNSELIAEVAKLYLKPRMRVLDMTFGRGVFWKNVDLGKLGAFTCNDINLTSKALLTFGGAKTHSLVHAYDFRKLPDNWAGWYDVAVLDPPYMHGGATVKKSISKCYGNKKTKYASHDAIMALYHDGIVEAWRVLKPGGFLWVKCQDEIESGKQRWSHIEILDLATRACAQTRGKRPFSAKDLFVLVQSTVPARRVNYQLHARKNHSYLWIFRKEAL